MKKIFKLSLLLFAGIALTVALNRCNKNYNDKQMATPTVSNNLADNSQTMTTHILAFKNKMEYYRNNPGLKSSEKKRWTNPLPIGNRPLTSPTVTAIWNSQMQRFTIPLLYCLPLATTAC